MPLPNRAASLLAATLLLAGCAATSPEGNPILYRWTQMAPDDAYSLRTIVRGDGECPKALVDGQEIPLSPRVRATAGHLPVANPANPAHEPAFAVTSCALEVPRSVREARIGGVSLPLAPVEVNRIVVVGDTGCRVQVPARGGSTPIQDCLNPNAWPWPRIAAAAAQAQPDLVIHVGDYHYREYCDDPVRCAVVNHSKQIVGYDWPGWEADFFAPATPLLASAPWIVVRGNHENCDRAGAGWQRLLSPHPYQACSDQAYKTTTHSVLNNNLTADAYRVAINSQLALIVADNAGHQDFLPASQTPDDPGIFQRTLATLWSATTMQPVWLVQHKPIWYDLLNEEKAPANALQATLRARLPAHVELVIAGHEHAFETINFAPAADREGYPTGRPGQLIVGTGGTQLEAVDPSSPLYEGKSGSDSKERARPDNLLYEGQPAESGIVLNRYGFFLLERENGRWTGRLIDADGQTISTCQLSAERKNIACSFPDPVQRTTDQTR